MNTGSDKDDITQKDMKEIGTASVFQRTVECCCRDLLSLAKVKTIVHNYSLTSVAQKLYAQIIIIILSHIYLQNGRFRSNTDRSLIVKHVKMHFSTSFGLSLKRHFLK